MLSKHQQVQLLEVHSLTDLPSSLPANPPQAAAILSHLSPTESGGTSLPEDRSLWPSYLSGGLLPLPNGAIPPGQRKTAPETTGDMSTSEDEQDSNSRPTLTQFRPGLLGHPNPTPSSAHSTRSAPVPVPGWEETNSASAGASWVHTPYSSSSGPFSLSLSYSSSERGWSLPKSSIRGGESDEEGIEDVAVVYENGNDVANGKDVGKEEEEWDGMEMEMDL